MGTPLRSTALCGERSIATSALMGKPMKARKASLGDAMMSGAGEADDGDTFGAVTPGRETQPTRRGILVRVSPNCGAN